MKIWGKKMSISEGLRLIESLSSYQSSENSVRVKQSKINFICSCLWNSKIYTNSDLINNIENFLEKINTNPKFAKLSHDQYLEVFKKSIQDYNASNNFIINFTENNIFLLDQQLRKPEESKTLDDKIVEPSELSRIILSYVRLEKSREKILTTSQHLLKIIQTQEFVVCPSIILGAGDTGTTVWLEKYKFYHGKTSEKQSPNVLMIGETLGSWKHDYTLAQRYSLLERGAVKWNPSDFVPQAYYQNNPYANARHIYQANLVTLAKTQAPLLLGAKIIRIEEKSRHQGNWNNEESHYRLIISLPAGQKEIYTNEIDICTGLGQAKMDIADCDKDEAHFKTLTRFDPKKEFTPIVSGDQFILTSAEERNSQQRTVVVYGGGGTAAASYRKAFFGHDIRTESREYSDENKKNNVQWLARNDFKAAGLGKLATNALDSCKFGKERFVGELYRITYNNSGEKLVLHFNAPFNEKIECDQLVYALGQDFTEIRSVCQELLSELLLDLDATGVPLCVKTKNDQIHFFGAAAMAIKGKEYEGASWNWLKEQKIGPDVGPGSMPGSRSQIRQAIRHYLRKKKINAQMEYAHVGIDNRSLLEEFLMGLRVEPKTVLSFINDIMDAREKNYPSSFIKHEVLKELLAKHRIGDKVQIRGLAYLVKSDEARSQALLECKPSG